MSLNRFSLTRSRALAVWALCLVMCLSVSCTKIPSYPEAPRVGQEIVVDMSSLLPDVPRYFTYNYKNKHITFFLFRSGEKVLAFFDACASCYPKKKGYSFDKGYFTCRACNVRYSISEMETGIGGCFPIRLNGSVRDGNYVAAVSLLEAAADKF